MSNYNSLKTTINANIKQNGNQEITGQILNSVLNQMVTTLGAGYQFAGVATTATNPGSPDAKVFYIANGQGTYTNFGGLQVTEDDVVVLYWDSSWHKVQTGVASQALLGDVANEVTTMREMVDSHDALLSGEKTPIQLTESTGNYITANGSVSPLGIGRISDPIHVSASETIIVTGGANSNVAMISKTDANGTSYMPVAIGTGSTQTTTLQTAEYRALEDGYVALCTIGGYTMSAYIKTLGVIESEIYSLQVGQELNEANIQSLRNDIGVAIRTPVSYTTTIGNFVSPSGNVLPFGSGRISSPIPVSQGEILSFTGVANSGVAMISKTNDAGSLYIPVVIGTGSTQTSTRQTAEYEVIEDGYVALSMLDSNGEGSAEIITYDGILGKLTEVKNEVGSLIPRVESLESNSASTINILAAFDNIVCVGDSLTYSQVYTGMSDSRQARRTYPQVLAGLCGNIQTTLARGGATALSCWNEFGSQVVSKTNPLAIIYLGTNHGVTDTLETDVVGDDPTNWTENNVGCYCRFVQKFLSLGYKVLLLRIWTTSGTGDSNLEHTNSAITHIAERFGCAVMDVPVTTALEYHYYPDLSGQNGAHYNDLGYSWFASKLIEKTGLLPIEQMKLIIPNA